MSKYPKDQRPDAPNLRTGWTELAEWEQSRAEHYKARVKELEEKINWWAYNLPILECKDVINEMLQETGEGNDDA